MTDPQGARPDSSVPPNPNPADTPPYWPYGTPPKPAAQAGGAMVGGVSTAPPLRRTPLRDLGGPVGALISWVIILAVAGLFFWEANAPAPPAPAAAPVAAMTELPPVPPLDSIGRVIVGAAAATAQSASGSGGGGGVPSNPLMPFAEMFGGEDPASRLRVSIIHAEVEGPNAGLKAIEKAMKDVPADSILQPRAEVLRRVYTKGPASLTPDEADALKSDHGWLGELALTLGAPATDPARMAVLDRAKASMAILIGLELVIFIGGGLAALICCAVAVALLVTGRVKPRLTPPAPGGSVFLEAFAVFLLGMVCVKLGAPFIHAVAGDYTILVQWAIAPLTLYPLFRGVPFNQMRFALGWHSGKGIFREIAAGTCGYLACMPIVIGGILLTLLMMLVNTAISGPAETPTHPIGKMLGGATIGQIIAVITLATLWAPLVEETVFRGALYHHLRGAMHWLVAGVIQGVIFAAIHPQGWMAIPALASIGISFSLLREWRTSLIAPITAHAMNNGTIVTLLIVMLSV